MTSDQARTLAEARDVLQAIIDESNEKAWTAASGAPTEEPRAQDYGRLSGTANIARDLVFDVLVVAKHYCNDESAAEWLHQDPVAPTTG